MEMGRVSGAANGKQLIPPICEVPFGAGLVVQARPVGASHRCVCLAHSGTKVAPSPSAQALHSLPHMASPAVSALQPRSSAEYHSGV